MTRLARAFQTVCVAFGLTCLTAGMYSMTLRGGPFGVPDGVILVLCSVTGFGTAWFVGDALKGFR